jgi:hypothetical protein
MPETSILGKLAGTLSESGSKIGRYPEFQAVCIEPSASLHKSLVYLPVMSVRLHTLYPTSIPAGSTVHLAWDELTTTHHEGYLDLYEETICHHVRSYAEL